MNKQSNERFKNLIKYIEDNLCEEINYKKLSMILGVNEYTMHRIFVFVTNYTLADYIRKRRLSMATLDLLEGKEKIIDIAIKYNYESAQAFSRAFKILAIIKSSANRANAEITTNTRTIETYPIISFFEGHLTFFACLITPSKYLLILYISNPPIWILYVMCVHYI